MWAFMAENTFSAALPRLAQQSVDFLIVEIDNVENGDRVVDIDLDEDNDWYENRAA
ncbi:unnamed protein product [Dovyalis caffra]|uniref:Uncharacterized protein n=1 Tax=Dovyalis caffra TaxID=77055 RepID=A0AAV1S633_9ROSI|nr:unnamed protein product [Dovyalis caffra]